LAASAQAADNKKKKNGAEAAAPDINQIKVEGLNPRGIPPAIQLVPMAPRLKTLERLTCKGSISGQPPLSSNLARKK
jgi:hypothetical protein